MSRPDRSEEPSGLDALLAQPTPEPEGADRGSRESGTGRPVRSRLEAWLRGGIDQHQVRDQDQDRDRAEEQDSDQVGDSDQDRDRVRDQDQDRDQVGDSDQDRERVRDSGQDWAQEIGAGPGQGVGPRTEPDDHGTEEKELSVFELVPVGSIEANAKQPRRHFDEAALAALTASVREIGVLQPVLVRPVGDDRFELVAGERRWRAARRAGLRMIPALVRATDDRSSLEQAIVENLHRDDLNPLEEAAAYRQLAEEFGLSQEAVAKRVGKSRPAVANAVRLLGLPASVQRLVREGELSAGHARALLGLADRAEQVLVAKRCLDQAWSVRQLEDDVRRRREGGSDRDSGPGRERSARTLERSSAGVLEAKALLEEALDTKVEVLPGRRGGRVVVRYADDEDLSRLVERLSGLVETPESTLDDD